MHFRVSFTLQRIQETLSQMQKDLNILSLISQEKLLALVSAKGLGLNSCLLKANTDLSPTCTSDHTVSLALTLVSCGVGISILWN